MTRERDVRRDEQIGPGSARHAIRQGFRILELISAIRLSVEVDQHAVILKQLDEIDFRGGRKRGGRKQKSQSGESAQMVAQAFWR